MSTILQCVYGLLLNPDKDDGIDSTLALSANNDSGEYEAAIMTHVQLHASRSCSELVAGLQAGDAELLSRYPNGAHVLIHGLSSDSGKRLNGLKGVVNGWRTGRYIIAVHGKQRVKRLKPCNVVQLLEEEEDEDEVEEDD